MYKDYRNAMGSAMQQETTCEEPWRTYTDELHSSLSRLETIIDDVADMRPVCRDEWCEVTECLLGEATVAAFAISEPHWASEEDSRKIKEIKKKIHNLHAVKKP